MSVTVPAASASKVESLFGERVSLDIDDPRCGHARAVVFHLENDVHLAVLPEDTHGDAPQRAPDGTLVMRRANRVHDFSDVALCVHDLAGNLNTLRRGPIAGRRRADNEGGNQCRPHQGQTESHLGSLLVPHGRPIPPGLARALNSESVHVAQYGIARPPAPTDQARSGDPRHADETVIGATDAATGAPPNPPPSRHRGLRASDTVAIVRSTFT